MKFVRVQLSDALSAVRKEFGVFQRAYAPYAPLLLLFFSSHPSTRESCSSPSVRCSAHSSSGTVSILWRGAEAAGRWQSQALNGRHLDGNPRVKPGETGRALCCDVILYMLTIREVCTVNGLNVSIWTNQPICPCDEPKILRYSCIWHFARQADTGLLTGVCYRFWSCGHLLTNKTKKKVSWRGQ